MPISPGKDESQDDWMGRCVPDMMGQGGGTKRPHEQAVAACIGMWNDAKGKKTSLERSEPDVPDPDDDESQDDFMARCVDEVTGDGDIDDDVAESLCELSWEESRSAKAPEQRTGEVVRKTHAETVHGMEFVLSDETPDRMGDVIDSAGWELTNFRKNPIALFNHRSDFPIGKWSNLRIENQSLRGHLELAPAGTSDRIDEIRRLIDAGILKAVSVGFVPVESVPRSNSRDRYEGERFTKTELVETSLVAVPANPNALAVAKSLRISPATLNLVFAEPGTEQRTKRRGSTGELALTSRRGKGGAMSLAQRITDSQDRITALREKLTEHLKTVDDSNVSDTQLEMTQELNAQIAREEKGRAALLEAEQRLAESSDEDHKGRTLAVRTQTRAGNGSRTPFNLPRTREERFDAVVRAGVIQIIAHHKKLPLEAAAQLIHAAGYRGYDDEGTRMLADYSARAATAPAMTNVTGWAAELVQTLFADLMELLLPMTVYPRLAGLGLSLSFGRAGKISIPTRSRTPTIAGSFVGEGQPIPVRQGAFTAQILVPKKLAVITTWTREIDEHSVPAIEGLLRQAIQEDTGVALDSVLLDTNAATAVRPAGIFNGVTPLTATAGGGFNAIVGDIKQLAGALITGTSGHIRNPAWLMNPQQVLSAGLIAAPGVGAFPFKDEISQGRLMTWPIINAGTVPLGTVGLIDAADFVSVGAEGPRFEISDQATLHMEDTAPANIVGGASPGTPAFPVVSMFQTDSIALRLIMPMNWTVRRPGVVAWVQAVTW